jgi:hypothetical protein
MALEACEILDQYTHAQNMALEACEILDQ